MKTVLLILIGASTLIGLVGHGFPRTTAHDPAPVLLSAGTDDYVQGLCRHGVCDPRNPWRRKGRLLVQR